MHTVCYGFVVILVCMCFAAVLPRDLGNTVKCFEYVYQFTCNNYCMHGYECLPARLLACHKLFIGR